MIFHFRTFIDPFVKKNIRQPFITNLFHVDGIQLGKSNKLTLWLLSCCIVEVPPHLRTQRDNMALLSMWVGTLQPIMKLWLRECVSNLKNLKSTGMSIDSVV